MAAETIPRRDFLKAAAAGTAIATNSAAGVSEATAQSATPRAPANPIIRPADLVLNSGKVITVDPSFTVAEAIAIFLATAGLITGEGAGRVV